MTPTQAGLLRAICETPGDDLARLVYADWLDEQGECNHAAFIRTQIAWHQGNRAVGACDFIKTGHPPSDTCYDRRDSVLHVAASGCSSCRSRIKIWRAWREEWKRPEAGQWFGDELYIAVGRELHDRHISGLPRQQRAGSGLVERGFVSEIRCPLAAFMEHAGTLFARHPITVVVLSDREPTQAGSPFQPLDEWRWFSKNLKPGIVDTPCSLHPDLFVLLFGAHKQTNGADWVRWYDTPEAAHAALSAACVAYGRDLVGLPVLTPTQEG